MTKLIAAVKYHISTKTGEPGLCSATAGKCPYATLEDHYPTKELAREAFEQANEAHMLASAKKVVTLPAFHGSSRLFDQFSYDALGASGTQHGWGFYFADQRELISYYAGDAGFIYDIDFHPQSPMSLDKLTFTDVDLRKFIEIADEKTNGEFLENWGDVQYEGRDAVLKRTLEEQFYKGEGANDVETVTNFLNTEESVSGEIYGYLYEKYGYDSIPLEDGKGWTDGKIYIATVPEAFDFRGITRADGVNSPILAAGASPCKAHSWEPTLEQVKDRNFDYRKCSVCEQVEKVAKS